MNNRNLFLKNNRLLHKDQLVTQEKLNNLDD